MPRPRRPEQSDAVADGDDGVKVAPSSRGPVPSPTPMPEPPPSRPPSPEPPLAR